MTSVVALTTLLLATPATGTGTATEVALSLDRCSFLPRDEIVRLVGLELGTPILAPVSAGSRATRVDVACDGSRVGFTVFDPQTGKRLNRAMALTARTENVATRMVALAISELVIASWTDLTTPTPPSASAADGSAALELRSGAEAPIEAQAPPGSSTGYFLALGQAIGPFAGVGLGWGGGVRIGWASGRPWLRMNQGATTGHLALDLDLTAAWTDVGRSLGTIGVSMWSAFPRASFRLRRGRAWWDLGAGGRFGLARLEGAPLDQPGTRGSALVGTWAGPAVYAGTGLRLGRVVLAAGVEAGTVTRTVAGLVDEGTSVSISGHWISGSVAVGWGS